jgi:hypothetical protein
VFKFYWEKLRAREFGEGGGFCYFKFRLSYRRIEQIQFLMFQKQKRLIFFLLLVKLRVNYTFRKI